MSGNRPAVITAITVMASAERLKLQRNLARNRNSTAEMRVPEWAMPTQKTKSVMYTPQPTGERMPATPSPS